MLRSVNHCYLCLLILFSLSINASEQQSEDLLSLSLEELLNLEVTVAARKNESWLSSSGTVYVIKRSDIESYGWRDLKEILATVPNMDYFYQWGWLPGGQRGFTGNMSGTLMLIDGREVQNLLANEAFIMNNFPSARIERVEILQGPNSTLYGGNAAQGVINVITRLNQNENEVSMLIGEANTKHGHVLFNHSFKHADFSLSASYFSSDLDYDELREFVVDDNEFSRNLNRDPLRNHNVKDFRNKEDNVTLDATLRTDYFYLGSNITRTQNVSGIEAVAYDYVTGDDSYRGYAHYFLGNDYQISDKLSGNIEVSYFSEYKEKYRLTAIIPADAQNYNDLTLFTEREDIGPSDRIRFKTQWQYQINDNQDWILGYDAWRTKIGRKIKYRQTEEGITLITPSSWPTDKEKSDKHAVYGQYSQTWKFDQRSIKISAGLRYNHQDFTDSSWLPRASLVYQLDSSQALKFTYGEAFRPPTIFEFDLVDDDEIESQTMKMFELNWSKAFKWQDIQFANISAMYHMRAENFYQKTLDPVSGVWNTIVTGQHSVKGWENQLNWTAKQWQGQLSFRYAIPDKTKINTQEKILDIPKYKIKLGVAYSFNEYWKMAAFIDHWDDNYTQANKFESPGVEIAHIPSWTTANLNISYRKKSHSLALYIENLFDREYFHGNARGTSPVKYLQPPRNIRIAFTYKY
ncbi:TonB-dependent receptor plug domain-containing protein [Colwelliaceae bacterium 6471]